MPVVHLFHLLRRTLLYRLIHDAQFTYVVSVQSLVSFDVLRTVFFVWEASCLLITIVF
jgi:hypothetical protein